MTPRKPRPPAGPPIGADEPDDWTDQPRRAASSTRSPGGSKRTKRTTARTLSIVQKQDRAVELKSLGNTHAAIAVEVGYRDTGAVSRAIAASLKRRADPAAAELRAVQDEQIAVLWRVVAPVFLGEPPTVVVPDGMSEEEGQVWVERLAAEWEKRVLLRLRAVDRATRLMERTARLHGLDAPVRAEVSGAGVTVVFHSSLEPQPGSAPVVVIDADR